MIDTAFLRRLAQAASKGKRSLAHMIPDSVIWTDEPPCQFAILRGKKEDIELAYAVSPDVLLALVAEVERLKNGLETIRDGFDCECVEGDNIRGHHECASCIAKKALTGGA